ncbi:MAG: DNA-directed RNA polymerase subunit L [Thermoplasmata archaeon]|nr:MAG: DNA-directed RNA polymerase subunit L [Thermoplasmata archaeon]
MEIVVKKNTKKEIEFEVIDENTILNPLKQKLLTNKDVEYAEWSIDHPLLSNPTFYVRVKKGGAKEAVKKAIEELKKEIDTLRKKMEE